ncbi:unnamed protein product [Mytilus coruscus]|uniref:Uncharacterized protein n=1 Tax=Mytilus coruscus TaxID=42192 RepID=A0A6J8AZG6_MYTCO|nr:unnamed protein product [Mytilus coruscus]
MLQELSKDASLLNGELVFEGVDVHKDDIFESLVHPTDDPVLEMYTQMALELCIGGMLLILERQAKDQLPGGRFYEPSVGNQLRGQSVPTTNTCSERDFAQLDMLVKLKPSASTTSYESIIMWSNNKTSRWLENLPENEKKKVIDDARASAPEMVESFKTRQKALFNKKLEILRAKRENKANKENKEYTQKVKLTGKLNELGGLWVNIEQIASYKLKIREGPNFNVLLKDALNAQLQFRKHVLKSKGPKEKFQQSSKGQQYSAQQLENNLAEIMDLNKENENVEVCEDKLQYFPIHETRVNINTAKQNLIIDDPEVLVGKSFKHKCKEEGSNEVIWCPGKVLSVHVLKGKKTEFCVRYEVDDDDTEWYFPLLTDMSNGDLIIDNM